MKSLNLVFITVCCVVSTMIADAAVTEWINSSSGSWHTATNWSNGVPSSGDSALIKVANITVTMDQDARAEYVEIGADAKLLIKERELQVISHGTGISVKGVLDNQGTITISTQLGTAMTISDSIYNGGFITITSNLGIGINSIFGSIRNNGQININTQRPTGITLTGGTLEHDSGASISITNSGFTTNMTHCSLDGNISVTGGIILFNDNIVQQNGDLNINDGRLVITDNAFYDSYGNVELTDPAGGQLHSCTLENSTINIHPGSHWIVHESLTLDRLLIDPKELTLHAGAIFEIR